MKIQTALRCARVICLIQFAVTFGQQTAHSQNTPPKTASSVTDTQRKNVLEYSELLHTDVQHQKAEIMGVMMALDVNQSAKFWPIYGEYDAELAKLNNLRAANIQDYARTYNQMADAKADELAHNAFDYRRRRSELLEKYYGRVKGSLHGVDILRRPQ